MDTLGKIQAMELRILTVLEESLVVILENQKALINQVVLNTKSFNKRMLDTDELIKKLTERKP